MYTPETSCVKRISAYITLAFRVRKLFGTFEKLAPGLKWGIKMFGQVINKVGKNTDFGPGTFKTRNDERSHLSA